MKWPFLIGLVHQNQLYVLNWKTLFPSEILENLEDRKTRWVYNRPIRRAIVTIYEHILGHVSWIKDDGHSNICPDQWERHTCFVECQNLDDILHAHNMLYLKYKCNPSNSLYDIWGKVVWKETDGVLEQQLYPDLDAQYESYVLSQHIYENISCDKNVDHKRKM